MVNGIGGKNSSNFQININKNLKKQDKSLKALSTGIRQDIGASANAIIKDLEASVKIFDQASRNINDAGSALAIAEGSLSEIGDVSSRLEELAIQSSNGTLSDAQRGALAEEFNALVAEVERTAETTEFNGQKLLTSDSEFDIQVGKDGSSSSSIQVGSDNISGLIDNLKGLDISTQAGAQSALGTLDNFRTEISSARGKIGADDSRLQLAQRNVEQASLTNAEAAATIRDVNVADETAKLVASKIKADTGTALLAQGNLSSKSVLKLIA